jgi:DNA polymerase-3 subunit delta'
MAWGMIGHAWAVDLLQKHLIGGQVRHAYLFTGPDGLGKRTLALRFAQALDCPEARDGEPCGECRACRLVGAGTHPDLHVVSRLEGESQLQIDQVRELERQLALAPREAAWRIALLVDFHEASAPASNALLKTLEEPASRVVLLLTAESAEALLPTIVSRCEVLPLRTLRAGEVQTALEQGGVDRDRARLIGALSGGRPGLALRMAGDEGWLERRLQHVEDLRRLLRAPRVERFAYVEGLVGGRKEEFESRRRKAMEVLEVWLSLWRDALILHHGAEAGLANPDREVDLRAVAADLDGGTLAGTALAMERTLEAVRKNANPQLALETLMLDLARTTSA